MNVATLRKLQELGLDLDQAIGVIEIMEAAEPPHIDVPFVDGRAVAPVAGRVIGVVGLETGQPAVRITPDTGGRSESRATVVAWPMPAGVNQPREEFDTFWDAYPLKAKKSRARAAWKAVREIHPASIIMYLLGEAAPEHIAATAPGTWLKSLLSITPAPAIGDSASDGEERKP